MEENKKLFKKEARGTDAETGIRYCCFGEGKKTMAVVPGLTIGFTTDNAQALGEIFSDFTDDYTVYVFDVREAVPADYTLRRMGEDLSVAMKNLGLKNVFLYGCSMGGMESICVAAAHPELVEKLVVAASACKANETSDAVIGSWVDLAKAGKCRELTTDMGQKIYSQAFYEANKDAFAAMADGLTGESLTRFVNTAAAIVNMDLTGEAAAVRCPVLVLGSEGDQVLTAAASAEIAQITGGELYLYGEEYPHAVFDEAPDFRNRVKAFFDAEA